MSTTLSASPTQLSFAWTEGEGTLVKQHQSPPKSKRRSVARLTSESSAIHAYPRVSTTSDSRVSNESQSSALQTSFYPAPANLYRHACNKQRTPSDCSNSDRTANVQHISQLMVAVLARYGIDANELMER